MSLRALLTSISICASCATGASAHQVQYEALLSGSAEANPNESTGSGVALVTFDFDLVTMRVEVWFNDLLGTTTAAHIHAATEIAGTGTIGVATEIPTFSGFPAGVSSGVYDHFFDMTQASSYNSAFITANGGTVSGGFNALVAGLDAGKAYLNIHTNLYPAGEIRGFLATVPEPSSAGLMVLGAIGAGIMVLRRMHLPSRGR